MMSTILPKSKRTRTTDTFMVLGSDEIFCLAVLKNVVFALQVRKAKMPVIFLQCLLL